MDERVYDLGTFTATSKIIGLLDGDPAYEVKLIVPRGPSYTAQIKSTAPVPASPTLYVVKDVRRLLKMGIQRFVQFKLMSERRLPGEILELQKAASQMYLVAIGIRGGDQALAQAEAVLEAEVAKETKTFEQEAQQASEGKEETEKVGFDLGSLRLTVHLAGVVNGEGGQLGAFEVAAEVPGLPVHMAGVASDNPLFSAQAAWYLEQLKDVLRQGPDVYFTSNLDRLQGNAEEGRQFAYTLFGIASALGPVGLQHAEHLLQKAEVQEMADANAGLLERLEEELQDVRKQIAQIKHPRKPRGAR